VKKILLVLCLVLSLCLLCSAALAYTPTTEDDYPHNPDSDTWTDHDPDSEFAGIPYDQVYRVHEYKFMDNNGKEQTHFIGDEEVYIILMPTCTERGIVRYVCSEPTTDVEEWDPDFDPEKHFHEQFIQPLGHDPIKWKTITKPTCTEAGLEIGYCKRCGAELERRAIDPLGHIMTSNWENWTDAEKAQYKPWDYSKVEPMSSWDNYEAFWGRVIKLPTCTEEGEALDFCPRCGYEGDTRVIEKLPHVWVTDWSAPNCMDIGYEWQYCTWCGKPNDGWDNDYTEFNPDDAYDAAYEVGAAAEAWHWESDNMHNFVYGEDDEPNDGRRVLAPDRHLHDWDNWVVLQDSTCHDVGFKLHWCKRCGDKAEVVIPVKEPVWVPLDSRLINCYTREVTFYCSLCNPNGKVTCKVCNDEDHAPYTVQFPVIAHVWDDPETVEEPWCETPGLAERHCKFDDQEWHDPNVWFETNPYGFTEEDYAGFGLIYQVEEIGIPELGHDWDGWVLRYGQYFKDQNDNEFGYWLRECKRCHKTEERVSYYAPADSCEEHQFEDLYVEWDASCWGPGSMRVKCTVCGYEKSVEIPQLEHEFEDDGYTLPATCENWGYTVHICKLCNELIREDLEPLGHTEITVPAVEPKCFEAGATEYVMCETCGAVLVEPEEIPAIGYHNYEKIEAVDPTCTEDGCTEGVVCTVCGDVMVESVVLPAFGHDYATIPEKPATCEEDGYTESIICDICGDVQKASEPIPAKGHAWGEWTVTTPATTEAEGVETRVCANDPAHVETRPIEKLPKAPVYTFPAEPEIDAEGWFTGAVKHDETTTKPAYAVVRISMYMPNGDVVTNFSLVKNDETFKTQFPKSMISGAIGFAAQVMAEVENPASPDAVFYGLGANWAK